MHWHRVRPHEAYLLLPPSITSGYHLRFTWCCKINGFIDEALGEGLCYDCYGHFEEKFNFTPLYTHLLSDGHWPVVFNCIKCYHTMVTRKPIRTCQPCTRIHLNFMTVCENSGRDFDSIDDPVVFYIEGHDFMVSE